MIKKLAVLFGIVFLLVGILGFVPGVTTEGGFLLGIFLVGTLHNLVHILSGVAALLGSASAKLSRLYFQIFGSVYALVAIIGIVQGDTILGLIPINLADNILHVVLAVAILAIGFGLPKSSEEVAQEIDDPISTTPAV